VIASGALNPLVKTIITVATQTYGATKPVVQLVKRRVSLLLIHGTADGVLPPDCSRSLQCMYQKSHTHPASLKPNCVLKLYEGDNHGITRNV
jgi:hypothetical protein